MGLCDLLEKPKKPVESYPPTEIQFDKINDRNPNLPNNVDEKKYKVDLFFVLDPVKNPDIENSFSISIINNTKLNINTFLGDLENRKGSHIEYGTSCGIDFFFNVNKH